jgi:hypothetical protein
MEPRIQLGSQTLSRGFSMVFPTNLPARGRSAELLRSSLGHSTLPAPVTTLAVELRLAYIVPSGCSISQGLFNASQVLSQPSQDMLATFAARQFGTTQSEDEWIGGLANSPDCGVGSLSFQATQASPIHKHLWILAYGSTTKFSDPVAGQAQND